MVLHTTYVLRVSYHTVVTAEELLIKQEDDELVLTIVSVEILHVH